MTRATGTSVMVERARFLASGQDDPHSVTIDELCDEIERLLAQRIEARSDETLQAAQPEGREPGGEAMRPNAVTQHQSGDRHGR